MRSVVILGSTGSIGTQALDLIAQNRETFTVTAITATGGQPDRLAEQVLGFDVPVVAVSNPRFADDFTQALATAAARLHRIVPSVDLRCGPDAVAEVAGLKADVVLNGIAGAAGLQPTLAALQAGSTLALANKESLIIGGPLVKRIAAAGQIVPVDSEHSALAQCLRSGTGDEVRSLILTASGGPFRGFTEEQLHQVTPAQALAHPTWSMGPLVTVNSASLVNKGLEVIEAHLLFDIPMSRISVVVHPQSVVHSMVEFVDGSTIAQASPPDMRLPISMGLFWPNRVAGAVTPCDWTSATRWEFFPLDEEVFSAVQLARTAGSAGGTAPAVFNAADEVCVEAFLSGSCPFTDIVATIGRVLAEHLHGTGGAQAGSRWRDGNQVELSDVQQADQWARLRARELLEG